MSNNAKEGEILGTVYRIALVLVIIGALNWGLIGFFQYDLVADLFGGQDAVLSRWVYGLVGLAGLFTRIPVLFRRFEDNIDASSASITKQYEITNGSWKRSRFYRYKKNY